MRRIAVAAALVCLLVAPSLGVINVKLTVDNQYLLHAGDTTTIRILAKADESGLLSLDGDVLYASAWGLAGPWNLLGTTGTLTWNPQLWWLRSDGGPGTGGGWSSLSASQFSLGVRTIDPTFAKNDYVEVASYQIKNSIAGDGTVVLRFQPGANCRETGGQSVVYGSLSPGIWVGVPEPATLALLALGGLLIRRRSR